MTPLPFPHPDPCGNGAQYLEDLATAYWNSRVLFTAVELDVFSRLDDPAGSTAERLAQSLGLDSRATERFLEALGTLGLVIRKEGTYRNTSVASDFLVKGKGNYQGNSILWRQYLCNSWGKLTDTLGEGRRIVNEATLDPSRLAERTRMYVEAMDDVARIKVREVLSLFKNFSGSILDAGAGSGAFSAGFLEQFPDTRATLLDLPSVLPHAAGMLSRSRLEDRAALCAADILAHWPVKKGAFDLVILSNVLHAYGRDEAGRLLDEARTALRPGGLLLIHDFFLEHHPAKAALFDLNMLLNTYNGEVFAAKWVRERLETENARTVAFIPLASDTGVILAVAGSPGEPAGASSIKHLNRTSLLSEGENEAIRS